MALSKRLISALIAFSMSATIATTAFAQTDNSITLNEEQNQLQTVEPSQEEKISIEYGNIPEQLDVEELKAQGFSARVKSEESDLSDIVLEKNDGTRALYIFDSPVKYMSDNGTVIDKSNKVIKSGGAFKSESNDIEVTLPLSLSSGITVDDEELNLSMRPIRNNNLARLLSVGKKSGEESVKYEDVFDEYTDIEYTYTYDGVKEDIILEKYNGTNKFDFELLTNGLELCEDKGVLLLKDNNGNVRAVIGEIVVFSADNKNNTMGKYQIIEKGKNNCYVISVTVDNEYLTSEKTKYPVTIDPYIKSNTGDGGIEDMQVFKGTDGKGDKEKSAGLSGVSRVGWSDWGACRTLLKFKQKNVLNNHGITLKGQIISASIEMRDLMCQGDEVPVYCTQFAGKSWNESGQYTWNALNAENTGKGGSMLPVSYANGKKKSDTNPSTDTMSHWFKWNVSNIVKNWVGNSSDIERGIEFYALPMLEGSSVYASYMKTFGSVQADAKYKPYFHIEYNNKTAILVSIKDTGHDHVSKLVALRDKLQGNQYNAEVYNGSYSGSYIKKLICNGNTDIVVTRSHGTTHENCSYITTNNKSSEALFPSDFKDGTDLSHIKIALIVGCTTVKNKVNLPNRMNELGAKYTIGFKEIIDCGDGNKFVELFFDNLLSGKPTRKSVDLAASAIKMDNPDTTIYKFLDYGDRNLAYKK